MPIKITSQLQGETSAVHLERAILLYKGGSKGVATLHNVHTDTKTGAASILPGEPLDIAKLKDVVLNLTSRKTKRCLEFLPETVLAISDSKIVWWCPSHKEKIFYKPDGIGADQKMSQLSGKEVWHPGLIFVADNNDGVKVFAEVDGGRPGNDADLYRAPYWNVGADGFVCMGNIAFARKATPRIMCVEAMEEIQRAFFNSFFTHAIDGGTLVKHPKGLYGYWKAMTKQTLWLGNLTKTNLKLEDLI